MCVCSNFQFICSLCYCTSLNVDVLISINLAAPKHHTHLLGCEWDEDMCHCGYVVALFGMLEALKCNCCVFLVRLADTLMIVGISGGTMGGGGGCTPQQTTRYGLAWGWAPAMLSLVFRLHFSQASSLGTTLCVNLRGHVHVYS